MPRRSVIGLRSGAQPAVVVDGCRAEHLEGQQEHRQEGDSGLCGRVVAGGHDEHAGTASGQIDGGHRYEGNPPGICVQQGAGSQQYEKGGRFFMSVGRGKRRGGVGVRKPRRGWEKLLRRGPLQALRPRHELDLLEALMLRKGASPRLRSSSGYWFGRRHAQALTAIGFSLGHPPSCRGRFAERHLGSCRWDLGGCERLAYHLYWMKEGGRHPLRIPSVVFWEC